MSVVIYGPQGCGKTRNAEVIKSYFGADGIVEGELIDAAGDSDNQLILTNDINVPHDHTFADLREIIPSLI